MTARMGSAAGAEAKAERMSVAERGVPCWIEREDGLAAAAAARAAGRRTSAVTLWFRDRASVRTWVPVRPVAPRRRMCMVKGLRKGVSSQLNCKVKWDGGMGEILYGDGGLEED